MTCCPKRYVVAETDRTYDTDITTAPGNKAIKLQAIVAAFKREVDHYLRQGGFKLVAEQGPARFYQSPDPELLVVEGGVGKQGSQEATKLAIERYRPDFIVCAGFAGGVRPGLGPADLVVCDRLLSIEGPAALWTPEAVKERQPLDPELVQMLTNAKTDLQPFTWCGCLSVPEFVPSSSMKSWIGATFPVSIIDMESYWVSETAAAHSIPHLVVRSVLDTVDETLPPIVGDAFGAQDGPGWGRAAKYIVRNPMQAPGLIRLAKQVKAAGASLSRFLTALHDIPDSPGAAVIQ